MDSLLESYAFSRSATRACSGIKPEYDGLAAIVTEFYFFACVVFDQKIRRNITCCEHSDLLKKLEFWKRWKYRQTGRVNPVGKEARDRWSGGELNQAFTAFFVVCILGLIIDN